MKIEGFVNPEHIVRAFIANEYAFELQWSDRSSVRVAHHKGTWCIAKIKKIDGKDLLIEGFDYNDLCGLSSTGLLPNASPFVKGFFSSKLGETGGSRYSQAKMLGDFINIWGGKLQDIECAVVVQPGRNAVIHEDGQFSLISFNS